MVTSGSPPQRLRELDALRGIGALLVINFHYSTRFHEMFPNALHVPFHIFGGNYRVLLFFAISGFAIFFSLRGLSSAMDFAAGRFARLFPAYWAAMAVTLVAERLGHIPALDIPVPDILVNVTMLQAYFYIPAVDGAYWTLAVELGFYASMLLVWRLGALRNIETVIIGWLALKCVSVLWDPIPSRICALLVLQWIPFFSIGMLSYRVWMKQRNWKQQLPFFAAILATIAATETGDIVVVALILVALFALTIEGRMRWICVRPLTWVGGISYSLYLVHQNVGFVIMLNGNRLGMPVWASYLCAIAVAFLLGWAINRWIERPAGRWIVNRWERRTKFGARFKPA